MADKVISSTPRGSVIQTSAGKAEIVWSPNIQRFNGQFSRAQQWLDNEVLKDTDPFVPFRSGSLEKSGILGTVVGSGDIVYNAPYAGHQYYGLDFDFDRSSHPQAQSQWFEASKAVNKEKWINGAKKLAGGG